MPAYETTAKVLGLPAKDKLLQAARNLIGLSSSLHWTDERVYETNAKRVEGIRDALGIYMAEGERWPKELK